MSCQLLTILRVNLGDMNVFVIKSVDATCQKPKMY